MQNSTLAVLVSLKVNFSGNFFHKRWRHFLLAPSFGRVINYFISTYHGGGGRSRFGNFRARLRDSFGEMFHNNLIAEGEGLMAAVGEAALAFLLSRGLEIKCTT